MEGLDTTGFSRFLNRLSEDPDSAAEQYEELRMKLTAFFVWKGALRYVADDLADRALDRVAGKVSEGLEIENVSAYTYSVARFVWLEHLRERKEFPAGDELPEVLVQPEEPKDDDARVACLRGCLAEELTGTSEVRLINGYYDPAPGEKLKEARSRLADELGITTNTLKVRACRLRARLETCIGNCLDGKRNSRN